MMFAHKCGQTVGRTVTDVLRHNSLRAALFTGTCAAPGDIYHSQMSEPHRKLGLSNICSNTIEGG